MSIELKQAAQQAIEAFDAFGDADDFATMFALTQKMNALRTAIQQATQPAEVTDEQIEGCALEAGFSVESTGSIWAVDGYVETRVDPGLRKFAQAIRALPPVQVNTLAGCNCRWDGDNQVEWCELHLAHKEAIHEWAERAKSAEQKLALRHVQVPMTDDQIRPLCKQGWVFETVKQWVSVVEAHHGITATPQPKEPS